MDRSPDLGYYRTDSVLNTDKIELSLHDQRLYNIEDSIYDQAHSAERSQILSQISLEQSRSGLQSCSHQSTNRSESELHVSVDNIDFSFYDKTLSSQTSQERFSHVEKSHLSLCKSRTELQSQRHSYQSTSFDSGFTENQQCTDQPVARQQSNLGQKATDHPVAGQPFTAKTSQASRSCPTAENRVVSESTSSLADVETVSWQSKTDELVDSLLRSRPAYRRRVPPAVPPRDVFKEPQLVKAAAHTVINISPGGSSDSETSGSHIETYSREKDDGRSTSQSSRTSSLATSRYNADDESTGRSSKTAVVVHKEKGFADKYRGHVSYGSDFEDDFEDHRDDEQIETLSLAAWQSLSSFSYEGDTQMGLADCLVARGHVISEADRDALKLDLSWIDRENPTPRRRLTRPATVTIRRGQKTATLRSDRTSATAPKGEGRLRMFFKRIRKLFSCCLSGNTEE